MLVRLDPEHRERLKKNTFDWVVDKSYTPIPLAKDEPWETISLHATHFGASNIVGIFSPLPQLLPRFHRAVRALDMPLIAVPPEKSSVARALIEHLAITGVVAHAHDMREFFEQLTTHNLLRNRYLQTILYPEETPIDIPGALHEVHLVPGIVMLFQCAHLAKEAHIAFHMSSRFIWDIKEGKATILDTRGSFCHTELPRMYLKRERNCPCGQQADILYI